MRQHKKGLNDVVVKLQGLNLNADDVISNFEGLISGEEARDIKLSPGDDERADDPELDELPISPIARGWYRGKQPNLRLSDGPESATP